MRSTKKVPCQLVFTVFFFLPGLASDHRGFTSSKSVRSLLIKHYRLFQAGFYLYPVHVFCRCFCCLHSILTGLYFYHSNYLTGTHFRWVLFSRFQQTNMKKDIKFRDSSVFNLILVFNPLNCLKYRDKMKQAKRILTLFHNRRNSHGMVRTSTTS